LLYKYINKRIYIRIYNNNNIKMDSNQYASKQLVSM